MIQSRFLSFFSVFKTSQCVAKYLVQKDRFQSHRKYYTYVKCNHILSLKGFSELQSQVGRQPLWGKLTGHHRCKWNSSPLMKFTFIILSHTYLSKKSRHFCRREKEYFCQAHNLYLSLLTVVVSYHLREKQGGFYWAVFDCSALSSSWARFEPAIITFTFLHSHNFMLIFRFQRIISDKTLVTQLRAQNHAGRDSGQQ